MSDDSLHHEIDTKQQQQQRQCAHLWPLGNVAIMVCVSVSALVEQTLYFSFRWFIGEFLQYILYSYFFFSFPFNRSVLHETVHRNLCDVQTYMSIETHIKLISSGNTHTHTDKRCVHDLFLIYNRNQWMNKLGKWWKKNLTKHQKCWENIVLYISICHMLIHM